MKPTTSGSTPPVSCSVGSSVRHSQQESSSKELDAKDLENQEISLCISTSSSINLRSSSTLSLPFHRTETTPHTFPTPTSSPRLNGNISPRNRLNRNRCNGDTSTRLPTSTGSLNWSYLTPPVTPSRPSLSSFSSSRQSSEELVLNMNLNWTPPVDLTKAVLYHQMSDDSELEYCVIPSSGSCVSVTKHSPAPSNAPTVSNIRRPGPPPYANGGRTPKPASASTRISNNIVNGQEPQELNAGHNQLYSSHVVIETLDDELQMTCSTESTTNSQRNQAGEKQGLLKRATPKPAILQKVSRLRQHQVTNYSEQHLKRKQQPKINVPSSAARTESANNDLEVNSVATKRCKSTSSNSVTLANTGSNGQIPERMNRPATRSSDKVENGTSGKNTSQLLKLNTRASSRRPK